MDPESRGASACRERHGDSADGMRSALPHSWLLARLPGRRPVFGFAWEAQPAQSLPRLSGSMERSDERSMFMTREQRKQLRRWALYMATLAGICLLVIAGLTA